MATKYDELKADIKCWERMFERQHKRKPNKTDVRNAPLEIRECYKAYMAMKKEKTLASSASGNDVFGAHLNKPREIIEKSEQKENLIAVKPNLRKTFEIKKSKAKQVSETVAEDSLMDCFGLSSFVSSSDTTPNAPVLPKRSFFSHKSSEILKNLEKQTADSASTFHEVRSRRLCESQIQQNTEFPKNDNPEEFPKPLNGRSIDSIPSSKHSANSKDVNESCDVFELTEDSISGTYNSEKRVWHLAESTESNLSINDDLLCQEQFQATKKRKMVSEESTPEEGNFVRLNMKSKKYRRPGKAMTGEAYKRKQWKSRGLFGKGPPKDWKNPNKKPPPPKWATGGKSKPGNCFKCGGEGHWASKCTGKQPTAAPVVTPEEAAEREELDFSSLEPMIEMGSKNFSSEEGVYSSAVTSPCQPLLDGSESDDFVDELLNEGLKDLGYTSFRPGQKEAVIRILQGKSTLLVLSTGGGKSLVYQLAAYLYYRERSSITLVISPLISLMDDQIQSLPAKLPGKCIHSHMAAKQKQALKEEIAAKKVPLLLLSPEALIMGNFGSLPKEMPPIGFVCIDEAHCLSSWSDNFRPAYLRVCDVLRLRYHVRCFLGLTATCTVASATNVCKFIGVDKDEGVLRGPVIRDNLFVTASTDQDRDRALLSLLGGERFKDLGSIIVYCTRRQQCERIATLLRTSLPPWAPEEGELCNKNKGKRKRKALDNSTAESYHAGLTPAQRSKVQYHFMAGTLRIVCATVAFGMGLDKANVRSVIHYSMPKSFENYVQEMGRAGRDGRPAHCHIFVDSLGGDLAELSKHAHSNTVDRYSVQLLLRNIFKPCACAVLNKLQDQKTESDKDSDLKETEKKTDVNTESKEAVIEEEDDSQFEDDINWTEVETSIKQVKKCPGHSVTFPIASLVGEVDVPEENIATMLTYLELSPSRSWIKVKQPVNATCFIQCYGGAAHLTALAKQATTVLAALRFYQDKNRPSNELEFPYIELAAKMGWDPYIVRRELRDLDKRSIPGFKTGVLVEFKDLSFHVHAPGDLSDEEMDEVTDYLYKRVVAQKNAEVRRLKELHSSLLEVSSTTHYDAAHEVDKEKDEELKKKILHHFTDSTEAVDGDWEFVAPDLPPAHILSVVQRDIRTFLQKYHELPLTGRVIARIFQGITSPNYPATTWGRIKQFWRRHIDVDFDWMVRCATEEIAKTRF